MRFVFTLLLFVSLGACTEDEPPPPTPDAGTDPIGNPDPDPIDPKNDSPQQGDDLPCRPFTGTGDNC